MKIPFLKTKVPEFKVRRPWKQQINHTADNPVSEEEVFKIFSNRAKQIKTLNPDRRREKDLICLTHAVLRDKEEGFAGTPIYINKKSIESFCYNPNGTTDVFLSCGRIFSVKENLQEIIDAIG